jgi:hypothetical protein
VWRDPRADITLTLELIKATPSGGGSGDHLSLSLRDHALGRYALWVWSPSRGRRLKAERLPQELHDAFTDTTVAALCEERDTLRVSEALRVFTD